MSYELEAYLAPLTALESKQNHPIPETVYRLTDEIGLVPLCGTSTWSRWTNRNITFPRPLRFMPSKSTPGGLSRMG